MIDPESLLRPIRDDAPTGINLREDPSSDSPYYRVKDARNSARTAERIAQVSDDPSSAPRANWDAVLALAPMVLEQHSKDLEIAAWTIEALVREEGFEGLRAGFRLARGLVEVFWDDLHPHPDEEGVRTRLAPIAGLNGDEAEGTLIVPIGMVPLLIDDSGPISSWHYRAARELAAVVDLEVRQRRIDAGAVTLERIAAAVASAEPGELLGRLAAIESCIAEYAALNEVFDRRCGSDAPPASSIRNALSEVLDCMRFLTRDLAPVEVEETQVVGAASAGSGGGVGAARAGAPGVIATRQDAVEALTKVRDFYRRTEPHSPVSYVVDKALRWSQMPLHLLVAELIPDSSALTEFQLRAGLPPSSNDSND